MPKRASREGSIRQRPDGRWEARYTVGRDPGTGKQVQKPIYGATQQEVRKNLQQAVKAIDEGTYVQPSKMNVGQWLDVWLAEYIGNVKEHTAVTYETQVRVHIKPALGALHLSALSTHTIQAFYNQLLRGDDKKPGLSPKTIKNIHGVLHRALDQAVLISYRKSNPCMGLRLPRAERPEIKPLMDEQIPAFVQTCRGNEYESLFLVDMFTGMRQSEIMGLTWDCVDMTAGTIHINKQLVHEKKKGGAYKFASPKNDKPRKIKPPPSVMKLLQERKQQQSKDKLRAGPAWNNAMNLVYTDALGNHYAHNTISHNFKRIVTALGLSDRRFHDLRHTYAVSAIQSGVDIKTVQENLGHHTAAFTLDVYGHVSERMQNEAANKMEAFIQGIKIDV